MERGYLVIVKPEAKVSVEVSYLEAKVSAEPTDVDRSVVKVSAEPMEVGRLVAKVSAEPTEVDHSEAKVSAEPTEVERSVAEKGDVSVNVTEMKVVVLQTALVMTAERDRERMWSRWWKTTTWPMRWRW